MEEPKFHDRLKKLIHEYILLTYKQTNKYPLEEKFGLTSQLKESIYCRYLGMELGYIDNVEYHQASELKEEIGAMLYKMIEGLKNKNK